ncbi:hypothetical protein HNQ43_000696 [Faecalicoccus acidiformans]|uniref:Uncharacterized protein n=1 Tax=Faecalicoccus acidiformans TaxID=915173 RepID=A0A7W8D322_9FIRM|nr:hypothetical protein [Faecalicoccus acidiformans]MBB5184655.1 hypothetical protein [Faecalicoccus acidiformans]MBM6831147.1 hypothetical protein [Faecalicoccus acidiformans]MDM8203397.1 hypothetical protein [Faecalicoccus acidiformans]HIW17857.1 hypothetical protein [Candidatus Faecalicoccus intestinipullorum]
MNDRQKVLFRQLQLMILGLVILAGGVLADHPPFVPIGILVLVYGLFRFMMLKKIVDRIDQKDSKGKSE